MSEHQTAVREDSFQPAIYRGLAGKVVLDTGAASGIGRAMAEGFARHGCRLMLLDINESALAKAREDLMEAHPGLDVETVVASVTDEQQVERAVVMTRERFGQVDIHLGNAGIAMNKPTLELAGDEWRRAIDIDLNGAFYSSRAVARVMVETGSGGVILNTASMWAMAHSKRRVAYCAAKAGVVSMTKSLAVEWAPYGIRVNAVCPGYTDTTLMQTLDKQGKVSLKSLAERTPLGRLGTPEEMTEVALFLASSSAAFVTGHALVADGGWIADDF